MSFFEWILWFLLPGDFAGLGVRRERINGTSEIDEGAAFYYFARFGVALVGLAAALAGPVFGVPGLADHSLAIGAIALVIVVLVWTVLPGISGLRAYRAARQLSHRGGTCAQRKPPRAGEACHRSERRLAGNEQRWARRRFVDQRRERDGMAAPRTERRWPRRTR